MVERKSSMAERAGEQAAKWKKPTSENMFHKSAASLKHIVHQNEQNKPARKRA